MTNGLMDLNSLDAYHFELPERLIAQKPAEPRDASRLLVMNRTTRSLEHRLFKDLPEYLDERDLLVANNTKVMPARFVGRRVRDGHPLAGGRVEFVLLEEREPFVWEGLFHASAQSIPGLRFEFPTPDGHGLRGEIIVGSKEMPQGTVVARFDRDPIASGAGSLPLPHYIRGGRDSAGDEADYQTVYARHLGSAAAPTAGLHFTEKVRQRLLEKGVDWQELTLHVGLGTFRPVKAQDISQHSMHEERYEVPDSVAQAVTRAKSPQTAKRVLAVGTTSVRALESAWSPEGSRLLGGPGRTRIFIRPPHFRFQVVDRLLTNFHLPRSTLFMLACAFADRELILAAYEEAVREEYRFFSYGDAMLIL